MNNYLAAVLSLAVLIPLSVVPSCKRSGGASGVSAAAAYCDCQQVLPVGDRPNYPRVAQPYVGTTCAYQPQIGDGQTGLTLNSYRAKDRLAFDNITQDVLGTYTTTDAERDVVVTGGVAVIARGQNSSGSDFTTITWIEAAGLAVVTKERLTDAATLQLKAPAYLAPLISLAPSSCLKR